LRLRESHQSLEQRTGVLESEIHERKRVEAELLVSNAAAAQANAAKSAFLANMSHELRTPLHAILGYAELLKEDAEQEGNASVIGDLQRIHSSSKQLLKLINDVLDVSNVDSGHIELRPEVDVAVLIADVVRTATPQIQQHENRLTVTVDGNCPEIWADSGRVGQILLHLLGNAAKFTELGSVALDVRPGAAGVEFSVRDSGIGIQAEHLPQLFVSFRQLDASAGRKYGGAGIGLALSRTLARSMGGDIRVESVFGQGSTFTLWLPARDALAQA
jgi:signal transduction histidine kinase